MDTKDFKFAIGDRVRIDYNKEPLIFPEEEIKQPVTVVFRFFDGVGRIYVLDTGNDDICVLCTETALLPAQTEPTAESSGWISVKERLPEIGEHVFVYGVLDESLQGAVCGDIKNHAVWITTRIKPGMHTDGNSFARMHGYAHLAISHWMPIPKINGQEIYETLPVD